MLYNINIMLIECTTCNNPWWDMSSLAYIDMQTFLLRVCKYKNLGSMSSLNYKVFTDNPVTDKDTI